MPNQHSNGDAPRTNMSARAWSQSEVFCIHSYAGEAGPPCGWHGLLADAANDTTGMKRCPRCGRATLMKIPAER